MDEYKVFQVIVNNAEEKPETHSSSASIHANDTLEDMLKRHLMDYIIEDNSAIGYIDSLDTFKEIVEEMKNKGFAFSIRDSDVRHKKKKTPNGAGEGDESLEDSPDQHSFFYQLKVMPIKFFGLPFTVHKTTHYQCAYGCKYYKSRAETSKVKDELKLNPKVKKKRNAGSKKMGCVARMTLKSITVYKGYDLECETDWRAKKKQIEMLRKDLAEKEKPVNKIQRYYVSISLQSSHNHPPIMILPKPPKTKKTKTHTAIVKHPKIKIEPPITTIQSQEDWTMELASTSITSDKDSGQVPVSTSKILNLQDENFFHTLVKYPNTPTNNFENSTYKPVSIEIQMTDFEPEQQVERTIEVQPYEIQTTSIYDAQTLFREKLKRLFVLSESCGNSSLLLRFTSDLEQMEQLLNNDIESYSTFE